MWRFLIFINTLLLVEIVYQLGTKRLRRIEKTMATQDDVKRLEAAQAKTQEAVQLVADDTAALKEELKKANENTSIDLSGAIATAEGMEARLRAIAGPNAGSDPEAPAPEPEPAPEG